MNFNQDNIDKDILPSSGAGQEGTDDVVDNYLKDTPGQIKNIQSFKQYIKQGEE